MNLASSILGSTAVKQLQTTSSEAILVIGSDRLTRAELAAVGCYNFVAARNLSAVLKPLSVKSLADVYARIPPSALALPRLGVISLAVLGAAFEANGIGGDEPLVAYMRKHTAKIVTFNTLKAHEAAEAARERAERRTRKEARRNQAHHVRVARFDQRAEHRDSCLPGRKGTAISSVHVTREGE